MNWETRRDDFLAQAKEADYQAQRTDDTKEKECWLRIAAAFRDLASYQHAS